MKRVFAALAISIALPAMPQAHAATADEILGLMREVCLPHGGSLPEIKWIARIRGWRPLSIAELEGARLPNDLGYMTGWAVADGDRAITLSIALPRWTFTAAMRTHQESGAAVLAPPPASLLMFGPNVRFPEQASMQFCDIRFDVDEDQMQPIASGIRQLPFLDVGRFGEPGDDREGRPMDGLFLENGARYWHWSSWQGDVWQQINFVVEPLGGSRSHVRVYQNWRE